MRPWSVDCPQCTSFLDGDPLWARSLAEVPESHDEIKARQQYELAGSCNQWALLTMAVARLAGIRQAEISPVFQQMISGLPPHAGTVLLCPSGHGEHRPA
ncbi:MAG TPA: hypothetical protein VF940_32920 [Streptosporangiaceae bacterium]